MRHFWEEWDVECILLWSWTPRRCRLGSAVTILLPLEPSQRTSERQRGQVPKSVLGPESGQTGQVHPWTFCFVPQFPNKFLSCLNQLGSGFLSHATGVANSCYFPCLEFLHIAPMEWQFPPSLSRLTLYINHLWVFPGSPALSGTDSSFIPHHALYTFTSQHLSCFRTLILITVVFSLWAVKLWRAGTVYLWALYPQHLAQCLTQSRHMTCIC